MDIYAATEEAYKRGLEDGKPKWISVKDRLPEELTPVLALSKYGIYETARWTGFRWEVTWDFDEFSKVTHWMPLPEAPKEVE